MTADSPESSQQNSQPAAPATSAPAKPRRARLVMLVLAALALVVGIGWSGEWWFVGRYFQNTDDAYLAADSVTIASKVSGYVAEVYVGDNASVKPGDPLVRLESHQYQAVLDQAQATIDSRQADIRRAEAGSRTQQAAVEQAQAQLQIAKLALRHAEDEVKRYGPLAETGAESHDQISVLLNNRDQARATVAADSAALDQAQARTADLDAQIAQAKAQLEAAQASARQSHLDFDDTVIRSTLAGRVGDRTVRVGQYAQPGTRLMSVVPVQNIYLTANFKETQVGRMRAGQPVSVRVDALPDVELHGVVDSFAPGTGSQFALLPPENATGNFTKIVQRVPVRIRLETSDVVRAQLVPGLSVTAEVDTRNTDVKTPRGDTKHAADSAGAKGAGADANG
ncbi:MAG: HlyD family secretion protein [Rudaea sp.]|uniref:HlyD family secretion protein n=1 Tax=unclassified Rudaea TaxID=2627037 RepID=UPI0010F53403|nr:MULTISPECIES: HlyD family secretion protein [unclassified Rudaea]MBN8885161.1 HlyD family secretion protein [Rudaea sp.]